MSDSAVVFGLVAGALLAALAFVTAIRRPTDGSRTLEADLDERLAAALPEERTHLERPPRVRDLVVVDRGDDGTPTVVPVVRIDLGTTDAPGMSMVFEFVADVLEVVHPALEEREPRVRHYDVQFTFGPDGLLVSSECRRASIPTALAKKLCETSEYRALDLRRDVERGDDGDDETSPVLWGSCTGDADAATTRSSSPGG